MKICQSCGMPLKQDPEGGGTNADGSKNEKYCSYCYKNGEFAGGNLSLAEFQDFCKDLMIKKGSPKFIAWFFTRGMGRLERWKSAKSA